MRRKISYLMLVIVVMILASVPIIRSCEERAIRNPKYHPALYWGHIQAVDAESSKPVNFDIIIDYDSVTPYIKGYGPSVEEVLLDGSRVVMLMGRSISNPVMITVIADGYQTKEVALTPMTSGRVIHTHSTAVKIINLQRQTIQNLISPEN